MIFIPNVYEYTIIKNYVIISHHYLKKKNFFIRNIPTNSFRNIEHNNKNKTTHILI